MSLALSTLDSSERAKRSVNLLFEQGHPLWQAIRESRHYSFYEEIVVDQLYAGNIQLYRALRQLIALAEETLDLNDYRRNRTILRMDAGGSIDDVNCCSCEVASFTGKTSRPNVQEDKQGFGMSKRHKKKAEAQNMLVLLKVLAHNVLVWARNWLAAETPQLKRYGTLRFVRDLLSISGVVELDRRNKVRRIILNRAAAPARGLLSALRRLLLQEKVVIILDKI
jgi:hypothetical protein